MNRIDAMSMRIERSSTKDRQRILAFARCMAIVAVAVMTCTAAALAQSPGTRARVSEDLRPAFANSEEIADGKRLAQASCVGCHGETGVSTTAAIPHIAGQRPAYLYIEMKAYRAGARGDNPMANAVKFLSDDALVKVSAYYANLEPAQPDPSAPSAPAPDPVAAGKAAAAACNGCHGERGVSKTPGMPSISGFDLKSFVAAMKAYRSGQRDDATMKSILASLSDADIANLALYYALEKPARAETPAAGDPAAGKAASAGCVGCHGELGVSTAPGTPSLAGQDAAYFVAAMTAYKTGRRSDDTMKSVAASADDKAIRDMGAFYAAQQPQAPNVRKPLSTAEWAQRCDRCHGINGNSIDPRLPALAGQRADYLELALNAYRTGARKKSEMNAMADVLSEDDVRTLATHYARQRARAVVFVTLPDK